MTEAERALREAVAHALAVLRPVMETMAANAEHYLDIIEEVDDAVFRLTTALAVADGQLVLELEAGT